MQFAEGGVGEQDPQQISLAHRSVFEPSKDLCCTSIPCDQVPTLVHDISGIRVQPAKNPLQPLQYEVVFLGIDRRWLLARQRVRYVLTGPGDKADAVFRECGCEVASKRGVFVLWKAPGVEGESAPVAKAR